MAPTSTKLGTRGRLLVVGVPLVTLSILGIAAAALTPVLVRDSPALLLVLESRNRYLLLVAAKLSLLAFVCIAVPRRLTSDPFYFLLGRWHGERAVEWAERHHLASHAMLRSLESMFDRWGSVLVFLFPGAIVCIMAGTRGMSWVRFLILNVTGSLAVVLGLWWVADRASGPIGRLVAFNDRNATWLTVVIATLVLGWVALSARSGEGPVHGVSDLEEPPGNHDESGDV
jgi:membrane protein DedA with SNARE-associated domain